MFLACAWLSVAPGQSLLSTHGTFVFVAGVPGDLESESTYRDQLKAWIELTEKVGAVERLFVLCDDPDSVTLPAKTESKVLKADRANFLRLAELAKGASSLTVIVWGHGGKQGSSPVFHVRGPRLTPADFRAVAAPFDNIQSHWILFFRGSGAFASELAAEGRQIVASERDTMFGSDPIGMALLLKLARDQPDSSLERLAQRLGLATTAWYDERHLARTEEPTLWLGKREPQLLASGSSEKSTNAPTTASLDSPSAPLDTQGSNAPPTWGEIKTVEGKLYPDCDAVRLSRRVSFTLGASPAISSEQEEFIQILNREGQRFGDFDISYARPMEEINFLNCEVRRADGKVITLDPDSIREAQPAELGDYQVARRKFFSLPGVAPGAILHVRYRTEWKKFPLPHVSLEIPMQLELPALESVIEVTVPKDSSFHFLLEQPRSDQEEVREPSASGSTNHASRITHHPSSDPEITQTTYGTTYRWRFENLPAQQRDSLVSPGHNSRLLFSTFPDWKAFNEWYARVTQLTDEVTPEIADKAAELTRDAKTDRDKVLALYQYVSALRYVAVPLGVNSFRPHAAANVLHNQFGDCKDKANLFNTMLRSLQVHAQLVLVPRFGRAYDALPGLAFNHAISRIALKNETLWVDTTDEVCRFGMLPPGDPGRKVLVMDGTSTNLIELPLADPKQHALEIHGEVHCDASAETPSVSLKASAIGFPDYQLRAAARELREHAASVPLLTAHYAPVAGSFSLQKQSFTSASQREQNFDWQADGDGIGLCSIASGQRMIHPPFWVPKEWNLALHRRISPLFLNQGYPLKLEEDFEFTLPSKSQPATLPQPLENHAPPLRWRIEWTKLGDDKLAAHFRLELARGELSQPETALFQQQLRKLLAALANPAVCKIP